MIPNNKLIPGACFCLLLCLSFIQKNQEVSDGLIQTLHKLTLKHLESSQQVQVWANDQLITAYHYSDTLEKPFLYPINTLSGKAVTRGFPYEPRKGERIDHPHHVGSWMNYGKVNGIDYWNNSYAKRTASKGKYGVIRHQAIRSMGTENNTAWITVTLNWLDTDGTTLVEEEATFEISCEGTACRITRTSHLAATNKTVHFPDNKEGFLGIRVARELEHPTTKPIRILGENGTPLPEPVLDNTGVTGEYLSSEGLKGTQVWGTRAKWMQLSGILQGESVQLLILDHPENPGYPTYWHARPYGLFAANPLGQQIFSHDKEVLDFSLSPGQSRAFKYQIIIHEGTPISQAKIEQAVEAFSRK